MDRVDVKSEEAAGNAGGALGVSAQELTALFEAESRGRVHPAA